MRKYSSLSSVLKLADKKRAFHRKSKPIYQYFLDKYLSLSKTSGRTGDADFHEKAEIALGVLYATDTLPIRRSALNGSNHKTLAAMIVLMVDQCLQVEVDEYNTTELKASGYSKSFMQYMERADARSVLEVVQRTPHTAIYYVGDSLTGVFADADY